MKVLLVDDEPIVTKALSTLMPWKEHGFHVVGTALNGKQALNIIERERPDLLIVDCKMPIMDGISLLQEIKSRQFDMECIILSGFDEFSYVQQAIRLGAKDYFIKPPNLEQLMETCIQLKTTLSDTRKMKDNLLVTQNLLQHRFYIQLIEGPAMTEDYFQTKTEELNISFIDSSFLVGVLQIHDTGKKYGEFTFEELQLIQYSIENIIHETLQSWDDYHLFEISQNQFVFIFPKAYISEDQKAEYTSLLSIINNIELTLSLHSTLSLSNSYNTLHDECFLAFHDAAQRSTISYITSCESLFTPEKYPNISYLSSLKHYDLYNLLQSLKTVIEEYPNTKLSDWYIDYFSKVTEQNIRPKEIEYMTLQLILSLIRLVDQHFSQIDIQKNFFSSTVILSISEAHSLNEIKDIILPLLINLDNELLKLIVVDKNFYISKAKLYIRERFSEPLSLDVISKEVHLAPAYLSHLFKQTEMISIIEYVTLIRMNHAKKLLISSPYKVNEIAERVGYTDNKYFGRLFKKKFGITPQEYRMKNLSAIQL